MVAKSQDEKRNLKATSVCCGSRATASSPKGVIASPVATLPQELHVDVCTETDAALDPLQEDVAPPGFAVPPLMLTDNVEDMHENICSKGDNTPIPPSDVAAELDLVDVSNVTDAIYSESDAAHIRQNDAPQLVETDAAIAAKVGGTASDIAPNLNAFDTSARHKLDCRRDSYRQSRETIDVIDNVLACNDDPTVALLQSVEEGLQVPIGVGNTEKRLFQGLHEAWTTTPIWRRTLILMSSLLLLIAPLLLLPVAMKALQSEDFFKMESSRHQMLHQIATAMRPYRATPWGKLDPRFGKTSWHALDYRDFPLTFWQRNTASGKLTFRNNHAGDLLEHSKWTALQAAIWVKTGAFWTDGVDQTLAILGSFLHDLGKAGDCAFSCVQFEAGQEHASSPRRVDFVDHESDVDGHCYLDTYSELKYHGQNDIVHPVYSAWYLEPSMQKEFWLQCPKEDEMQRFWHAVAKGDVRHDQKWRDSKFAATNELEEWKQKIRSRSVENAYVTSREIVDALDLLPLDAYKVLVAVRMHWDLGRMNMPSSSPMYLNEDSYLRKFAAIVNMFAECGTDAGPHCISSSDGEPLVQCRNNKQELLDALRLSIAVAAADIAGGSPSRDEPRQGIEEVTFVTDASNAAEQFCWDVISGRSNPRFDFETLKLLRAICKAGCHDQDCALSQKYPALDAWTQYHFGENGFEYRQRLLQRFEELTATDAEYDAWCRNTMDDLPEMPRVQYRAVAPADPDSFDASAEHYFIQSLPRTGWEKASCKEHSGFVEGLCESMMSCDKLSEVKIPCSKSHRVSISDYDRHRLKIPTDAVSFAFVYGNQHAVFGNGGFIYFGKDGEVLRMNYLVAPEEARDRSCPLMLGRPHDAMGSDYNDLHHALNEGVDGTAFAGSGVEKSARYSWIEPDRIQDMPHGGFAYILK